jgi:hypothetical protein
MKVKIRFVQSILMLGVWLSSILAIPTSAVFAAPASQAHLPTHVLAARGGTDSDHDGLTDAQERACGTNPKVSDSNHNGILDGADDRDRDGLSNRAEFQHHTKCNSRDSDHDGISDGQEVNHGSNPNRRNGKDDTNHPEDH